MHFEFNFVCQNICCSLGCKKNVILLMYVWCASLLLSLSLPDTLSICTFDAPNVFQHQIKRMLIYTNCGYWQFFEEQGGGLHFYLFNARCLFVTIYNVSKTLKIYMFYRKTLSRVTEFVCLRFITYYLSLC